MIIYGTIGDLRETVVLNVTKYVNILLTFSDINLIRGNYDPQLSNDTLYDTNSIILDTGYGYNVYGLVPIVEYLSCNHVGCVLLGLSVADNFAVKSMLYYNLTKFENFYYKYVVGDKVHDDLQEQIEDIKRVFAKFNFYLAEKTYLVGENVTLADISIFTAIFFILNKTKYDLNFERYPHLIRWFYTIARQCNTMVDNTVFISKVEDSPDDKLSAEEKAVKELDNCIVNFDMDAWKRVYFNSKDLRTEAMPWLTKHFDRNNMSIFVAKYSKTSDELQNMLISTNQLCGFIQRFHPSVRKHCFIGFAVVGEGTEFDIVGFLIVKGKEMPKLISEIHPSFEFYSVKRMNIDDPEDAKVIEEYLYALKFNDATSLCDKNIVDVKFLK